MGMCGEFQEGKKIEIDRTNQNSPLATNGYFRSAASGLKKQKIVRKLILDYAE